MQMKRRTFCLGGGALALSGCVAGGTGGTGYVAPQFDMVSDPGFDAWVAAFRPRALGRGISAGTFDAAYRGAGFIPLVVERDRNQTEFTRTTQDYLAITASDERVALGRQEFANYRDVLNKIEQRYSVDAQVVAAIWGVESFFGTRRGTIPVISSLTTLAYDGRRADFFEQQLVAALKILQAGDVAPSNMVGSWAGAMGHTQFIPTSYLAYAVDFTGDGRRDIWSDDPTDSLASTANYLHKAGWTLGQPWGVEVVLPAGFNTGLAGRGKGRSPSDWAAMGVRAATGGAVPNHGSASILLPSGPTGPAFMIFNNFNVIARYNNAENYIIGVGHLSDRLIGGGPIKGSFPPDKAGMTLADRQELQRRLTAAGYDTQGSDGVIGAKTIAAVSAYQRDHGLEVTGQPSLALLQALRG